MEKQFLFENEEVLYVSGDNSITLTSRRIQKQVSSYGNAYTMSMHLEKISAIETQYNSAPIALVLGILSIVGGLLGSLQAPGILLIGLIVGLIFILIYFLSRHHVISIIADSGSRMKILTKRMKAETVLEFVNNVEKAKSLIK